MLLIMMFFNDKNLESAVSEALDYSIHKEVSVVK